MAVRTLCQLKNGWIGNVRAVGNYTSFILKDGVFSEEQSSVLSKQIRIFSEGLSEYPLLRFWQIKGLAVGLVRRYPSNMPRTRGYCMDEVKDYIRNKLL